MKTWIKKHFALTDKGAGDIVKAIISSFFASNVITFIS